MDNSFFSGKSNWKIAVLFAAFLPTFNIIINSQHRVENNVGRMFLTGSVTFFFLLIAWLVNSWLTSFFLHKKEKINLISKGVVVLLANAILLALFVAVGIFVLREINNESPKDSFTLWLIPLKGGISIALIYIIQYALNSAEKAQEVSLQNEMLKTENVRSQFEILRQQVNPHFLFNSLSTLRSMVRAKDPKSEEFVLRLSEIYRQLLAKRQFDTVSLKEELEFVNDYLFMLFSRFGAALKIVIDIPEENLTFRLPTFSLQLLLENCIKHNVISSEKPLEIKIFSSPGFVTIENHIQPKQTEAEHSGYGLENLIQRYKLLGFPEDGVFVFTDEDVFRVRLKLLEP
jgi:two-component system, LytTR family, sensor kinase